MPGARLRGTVTGHVHAEGTTRDLRVARHAAVDERVAARSTLRGTVALRGTRTRYDVVAVTDALDAQRTHGARAEHAASPARSRRAGRLHAGDGERHVVRADLTSSRYDTLARRSAAARGSPSRTGSRGWTR